MATNAKDRWHALWTSYLFFLDAGLLFFVLPPLLEGISSDIPLSDVAAGWLQGAYAIPAVMLALVGGELLDRLDTRSTAIASALLMLGGNILFSAAPDYTLMFIGRFIGGLGSIIANLAAVKITSIWFRERQRGLAMSVLQTAWPLMAVLAFSTFAYLGILLGWRLTSTLVSCFIAATAMLFIIWAPRGETAAVRRGPQTRSLNILSLPRDLWLTSVSWFCFTTATSSTLTFGAFFFAERGTSFAHGSFLTGLLMWMAVPGSLIAGCMMDRIGQLRLYIMLPSLGAGLCLLCLLTPLEPILVMLATGMIISALPVAVYALPGQLVNPRYMGLAFGILLTFSNLGNVVGPVVIGWINTLNHGHWAGIAAAAAALLMAAASAARIAGHKLAPGEAGRVGDHTYESK